MIKIKYETRNIKKLPSVFSQHLVKLSLQLFTISDGRVQLLLVRLT